MGLYKRGRKWWYKFEFRGKPYQGTTRLTNQRLAASFEAKLKSDLALGLVGLAALHPAPSLAKYADRFKAFLAIHNKNHPRTIEFYEEKLERLLEHKPLAEARLSDIDEKLIETYVMRRSLKVGPATINRELATLRRALRIAWRIHKLISGVPVISRLPGEGEREFVLSQDQEKLYLEVADDTLRDFALVAIDTGMRAGELVALPWDDVHPEPVYGARLGYIQIRKGKTKNAARIVSISPRVGGMLDRRRRFFPKDVFVFPGRDHIEPETGKRTKRHVRVTSIDHLHATTRDAVNIKIGIDRLELQKLPREFVIHSLRHTFGTRLGESGADAFDIMKAMGHSSITVSQKYVHPTPDRMERTFEALDRMNRFLRGEAEEARPEVGTKTTTAALKR